MTAFDPRLLEAGTPVPDEETLTAADPTGAWGALVILRADALDDTPPGLPVPDLDAVARWAAQTPGEGDDGVPFHARRSLLMAEILEGTIDGLAPAAVRRLAAAPDRGSVADPWPARYAGAGWRIVLGVDEAGWLYVAVQAAPEAAAGDGLVELVDVGVDVNVALQPGAAVGVGAAEEVLGGLDFNPIRTLRVAGDRLRGEPR